jgi:hypothetical protein
MNTFLEDTEEMEPGAQAVLDSIQNREIQICF